MSGTKYIRACAIAAAGAFAVVIVLWILSSLSWAFVWAFLTYGLIPLAVKAIKFYEDNECMDIEDFFTELIEYWNEERQENTKTSQIEL